MSRKLASLSLFCAWLCASGAMLDVAQGIAWTRMFAGYARSESIAAAAKDTFDPGKPCALCRAVSEAREALGRHGPAVPTRASEKITLVLDCSVCFVPRSPRQIWPDPRQALVVERTGEVPVPPPKSFGA